MRGAGEERRRRRGRAGITATPAALAAIARLVADQGPVMLFQSGGGCDGSLPMCFKEGELIVGDRDELLATVGGCPYYIDGPQFRSGSTPSWSSTSALASRRASPSRRP